MNLSDTSLCGILLPHPPILVKAVGQGREAEAGATLAGIQEAVRRCAAFAPETVVVISPHAPLYRDYLYVYSGETLSGTFSRFGAPNAGLSLPGDREFAEAFLERLSEGGIPGGSEGPEGAGSALDHGVLVPLWFLSGGVPPFSLVALSQSALGEDAILQAGRALADTASALGRRTCIVASGDMSHRVNRESPYGMAREGALFDQGVCEALRTSQPSRIRQIDSLVREEAGECGYRSLVMLEGAMPRASTELLSYEAPFGIGYCVAFFSQGEAA